MPGYRTHTVLRGLRARGVEGKFVVSYSQWDSKEAYDAFRGTPEADRAPERQKVDARVAALATWQDSNTYRVVHTRAAGELTAGPAGLPAGHAGRTYTSGGPGRDHPHCRCRAPTGSGSPGSRPAGSPGRQRSSPRGRIGHRAPRDGRAVVTCQLADGRRPVGRPGTRTPRALHGRGVRT